MTQVLRDGGLSRLMGGELETIATGYQFTEGPLWLPGGRLLFQDVKSSKTHEWLPGGAVRMLREKTRGANGQTIDPSGGIVFCEQDGRRVSWMDRDGSQVRTIAERYEGKRL